mgnify:CR=1 FL=1
MSTRSTRASPVALYAHELDDEAVLADAVGAMLSRNKCELDLQPLQEPYTSAELLAYWRQAPLLRQRVDRGRLAGVAAADEGDLGHIERRQVVQLRRLGQETRGMQPAVRRFDIGRGPCGRLDFAVGGGFWAHVRFCGHRPL